jgi:hypothetical protein
MMETPACGDLHNARSRKPDKGFRISRVFSAAESVVIVDRLVEDRRNPPEAGLRNGEI